MFTSSENRPVVAAAIGWGSVVVGAFAGAVLIAATVFRAFHGFDRQSDAFSSLASAVALVALLLGMPSASYVWLLGRRRLAFLGLVLSVLPLTVSFLVGRFYSTPY